MAYFVFVNQAMLTMNLLSFRAIASNRLNLSLHFIQSIHDLPDNWQSNTKASYCRIGETINSGWLQPALSYYVIIKLSEYRR